VREFIRLFRSLSLRQILGLQLAWTSSLGFVFAFSTWLNERDFHTEAMRNVAYSMSLRWQLETGQIVSLVVIVAAPFLLWVVARDRRPRRR
jgi:prolipoprotein diacylglyceryltransferase